MDEKGEHKLNSYGLEVDRDLPNEPEEVHVKLYDKINKAFEDSVVGKFFDIKSRGSCLTTEIRAGCVTFLTLAYILAVNANIMTDSGGTCSMKDCTGPQAGKFECIFGDGKNVDPGYQKCLDILRQNIITATAASSLVGTFLMGVAGNLPLALAPGMGLNAYFTYNVVGYRGTGAVSYQTALAAIFVEGIIFNIISFIGVRGYLVGLVPRSLALASSAGIGMFLAFIGFQWSEGIGLITMNPATIVTLGGCSPEHWVPVYTIANQSAVCTGYPGDRVIAKEGSDVWSGPQLGPPSGNHVCAEGSRLKAPTLWLAVVGFVIIAMLMSVNFRGALLVGICFVTIIAWIPGHSASYLGADSTYPGGIGNNGAGRTAFFKSVIAAPTLSKTGFALNFHGLQTGEAWSALLTFLYVDFLETTGFLLSMAEYLSRFIPGFMDPKTKTWPRCLWAYLSDGTAISIGALMGTSPLTAYAESATGIREGGRTGVTSLMVCVFYALALFMAPILASIPGYATGPALILVGALLMVNTVTIPWEEIGEAVPAFLTIILMPLTYSIAYGLLAGIGAYIVLNLGLFIMKGLHEYFVFEKQLPEPSLKHAFVVAREKWVDQMGPLPTGGASH